jgi:thiol:disulfide interchange protein DsbC
MTRFSSRILRTIALPTALLAASVAATADDKSLEEVRARITQEFDIIQPEHINPSPIDGWYTIQKGSIVAYVTEDGRYLMQGDLIDLETQVNLTEHARDDARRGMMASLGDDHVITFAPKDVKHTVTVFTDIGCTYCRRLHSQIDEYLDKGIAVRYVLYPRNGPASADWSESERVWCASDRNRALTAAKLDKDFASSSCDASVIQDNYILGQEVGLSGTPAIVLEDGTLIGGYVPAQVLADQLEHTEPQASAN